MCGGFTKLVEKGAMILKLSTVLEVIVNVQDMYVHVCEQDRIVHMQ